VFLVIILLFVWNCVVFIVFNLFIYFGLLLLTLSFELILMLPTCYYLLAYHPISCELYYHLQRWSSPYQLANTYRITMKCRLCDTDLCMQLFVSFVFLFVLLFVCSVLLYSLLVVIVSLLLLPSTMPVKLHCYTTILVCLFIIIICIIIIIHEAFFLYSFDANC
jgi:hypothetical protein